MRTLTRTALTAGHPATNVHTVTRPTWPRRPTPAITALRTGVEAILGLATADAVARCRAYQLVAEQVADAARAVLWDEPIADLYAAIDPGTGGRVHTYASLATLLTDAGIAATASTVNAALTRHRRRHRTTKVSR